VVNAVFSITHDFKTVCSMFPLCFDDAKGIQGLKIDEVATVLPFLRQQRQ
jgi:hypothetical protein